MWKILFNDNQNPNCFCFFFLPIKSRLGACIRKVGSAVVYVSIIMLFLLKCISADRLFKEVPKHAIGLTLVFQ